MKVHGLFGGDFSHGGSLRVSENHLVMERKEPTLRLEGTLHLGFTHPPSCLTACQKGYSGSGAVVDVGVGAEFGLRDGAYLCMVPTNFGHPASSRPLG